jgi:hypothetical protein
MASLQELTESGRVSVRGVRPILTLHGLALRVRLR